MNEITKENHHNIQKRHITKTKKAKLEELREEVINYLNKGMHYHAAASLSEYIKITEEE